MSNPDRFEALMLEHLYGLLEPDEARELQAYLATPEGDDLRARAEGWKDKLSGAAKVPFDDVQFVPPVTVPARKSDTPRAEPRPVAIRTVWTRWIVAASLLLVVGGLGGPATYQLFGWYGQSRETNALKVALNDQRDALKKLDAEQSVRREAVRKEQEEALAAHQATLTAYRDAIASVQKAIEKKDFTVRLTGPDRIQPGAPNAWTIETLDRNGRNMLPRKMDVLVRDDKDKVLLRQTHEHPSAPASLQLPASFWQDVRPGSDLFLEVVAHSDDNRTSALTERLPLARPVYVTHLVTDKPLYRPGETVRFRSLTLDRATFLPPPHDQHLKFRLLKPDGAEIPREEVNGRAMVGLTPLLGPDGKPVRGVGVGEYVIPEDFPGGEYTLEVAEVSPTGQETVLEVRKFLVNSYKVDAFEKKLEFDGKSYGPGDLVQARIEVSRTAGGPMKNAIAIVVASVDGEKFFDDKNARFEVNPDPQSRDPKSVVCNVCFKLPADLFANREDNQPLTATLAVTVIDGTDSEKIVRPIPLVEKNLRVEFFPEGGDLVAGVPGRVYFQVRTPSGKPADLKGTITDGTNTVAEVATLTDAELAGVKRGQGVFALTPKAGVKYFLKLRSPVGITEPTKDGFPLPETKADGVVLTAMDAVTDKGAAIRVTVQAAKRPKILHVGAYARGRLICHQRVEAQAGKPVEVKLQGDEALGGVTRVTVFEEPAADGGKRANLIPRAERLVYRKPGEHLSLTVNPDKSRYSPSDKVALELTALNEKEQRTPAILLVGVVNQSVIAMADNKTDRLLPTHFLLAGDVKNAAELEHADFLLTDHPRAAVALDLLLGTQGWRRFAEQNVPPRSPADRDEVERMLVAHGQRSSAPLQMYRLEEQRRSAEYSPKLEQSAMRRKDAEAASYSFQTKEVPVHQNRRSSVQAQLQVTEDAYEKSAAKLYAFETRGVRLRSVALPAFLLGLLALAAGGVAFAVTRPARERRRYFATTGGALVMASLVVVAIGITLGTDDARVAFDAVALKEAQSRNLYGPNGRYTNTGTAPRAKATGPEFAPVRAAPTPPEARKVDPKVDVPVEPPEIERPEAMWNLKGRPGAPAQTKAPKNEDSAPEITGGGPFDPAVEIGKKGNGAPIQPPVRMVPSSIVREYAHFRDPSLGSAPSDFTETVYWHPVLVLPDTGQATVNFQLSDDVARYQILVVGHTTDGRIGGAIKTIEATQGK